MAASTAEEYERRKLSADSEYERWRSRSSRYALASLAAVGLLAQLVWSAIRSNGSLLAPAAVFVCGVFCVVQLLTARARTDGEMRLACLYEDGLDRVGGRKTQTGRTGEAFAEKEHLYARDLGIVGAESLFGMLATTRTALGERELAALLLRHCSAEEARQRQAAVQELSAAMDLRERVALLGRSAYEELPAKSFERWLEAESRGFPKWLRPVLLVLTIAWMGVLVAGLLMRWDPGTLARNCAAVLALQGAVCLGFRTGVREELELAGRLAGQTALLQDGIGVLRDTHFAAEKLRVLQNAADGAGPALTPLERLLAMAEQRSKEWFYAPALLLGIGTHAAVGLEKWRKKHGPALRQWLRAWGEFDALLALSTYAAEHPENVLPRIVEKENDTEDGGAGLFMAEALMHPLLPRSEAVANHVSLDAEARFLLISGSNMAGKSTLLRAVGTNAVLALAGAPVPARSLTMQALRMGASITVGDSLAERKSKFLAEVERLRAIVALAREDGARTLFLIDEIFSGTNSLDRRAAAEAVSRSLVEAGAIGAISTHDLTLTALAELPELHGRNVHMASPDEDDPLGFDYKLKEGANRTTNAMAIVRMLGLM